ncbi:MAG: galactokinase [Actinomycetota bacterium]|nr:galactokinase [Actinomycetota bacterium]MDQ3680974.1 galactokinase [Actinomycetota bacterium]
MPFADDAVTVRAYAPGRVNLIGDHTDYTGGLVLPMAIDRGTTVVLERSGEQLVLKSADEEEPAVVHLDMADPTAAWPPWARLVAGVVHEMRPPVGGVGTVRTDLPIGAGLSSSAALEVALALALGFDGPRLELARVCQRAEQAASGVPCGIMDQLASAAGVPGHGLLIDCSSLSVTPVPVPDGVDVVVVHSGQRRSLSTSAYAERRAECEAATAMLGPLREANVDDVAGMDEPVLRRRARHVVTENARVLGFAGALAGGDLPEAGRLMVESHRSLATDFDVSTTALDRLVDRLLDVPGVHGARLTGAGFGGCVVALAEAGALDEGWLVKASGGATVDKL